MQICFFTASLIIFTRGTINSEHDCIYTVSHVLFLVTSLDIKSHLLVHFKLKSIYLIANRFSHVLFCLAGLKYIKQQLGA